MRKSSQLRQSYSLDKGIRMAAPSMEDILALKQERKSLEEERDRLKIKISRLEVQRKRAVKGAGANNFMLSQIEKEFQDIEFGVAKKREELKELLHSDAATRRLELQERAKIMYQERSRLHEEQLNAQLRLSDIRARRKYTEKVNGIETVKGQSQRIKELQKKLKKYQRANTKQRAKLARMSEVPRTGESKGHLVTQIREVEAAIAKVERDMAEAEAKHSEVMKKLRLSVLDKAIDLPDA